MGDRYGWQPVPSRIPSSEMGPILGALEQADAAFIQNWYKEDLNAVPPEYVLQPRGDAYRLFDEWKAIEDRLRMLLRDAVNTLDFTEDQRIKYFASATHQEIIRGTLNPPQDATKPEEHVFAYMRTIRGLPEDSTAKDFIDLAGDTRDAYAMTQLESLKVDLKGTGDKKGKLPEEHIYEYDARWKNGCVVDDLTAFGERVFADLERIIEQQLSEITEVDATTKEERLHEKFRKDRLEHFTGREEALREITGYLGGKTRNVLSIIGPSGSGKTCIMAKAIEQALFKNWPSTLIVYRFAGATSGASDTYKLLYQIIQQITVDFGVDMNSLLKEGEDDKIFSNVRGLKDILSRCLLLANSEKPLIIFIDALDQLSSDYASLSLDWLPQELPENVRMVISALPVLKEKLLHTQVYEINPMSEDDGSDLLERWLKAINRTLQKVQREEVVGRFAANGTPLYLKFTFERARTWPSYWDDARIKPDIDGMLGEYFDGLQKTHGNMLVQKFCGYVLSSKYQGLTESELLELFVFDREHWERFLESSHPDHREEIQALGRLPIVVWSRLFLDLEPYLTEKDATGFPIISFYHRQFAVYAVQRYLTAEEPCHKTLADYFETRWKEPYIRALDELPWQRTRAKDTAGIENVLTDLEFIEAKCRAEMNYDLAQDYKEALALDDWQGRERVGAFQRFFMKESHVLRQYPELTFQQAMNQPDISEPYKAADILWTSGRRKRPWFKWVNKPQHVDSCIMTLEGHTSGVTSCAISPDGKYIVSGSWDKTLKVWDIGTGAELATLKGHTGSVESCAISPNGKRIVSGSQDKTLKIWDMENGEELATLEGHTSWVSSCAISPDGKRIVSGSVDKIKIWDIGTGAELVKLQGHASTVESCAISPDGKCIVTSSGDKTLKIWDIESGKLIATLIGHTDSISSCAISPDGRLIVSGSGDKTLKIWDMESKRENSTLKGHTRPVSSCAISPDGRLIVSGSESEFYDVMTRNYKTLKIWDMESGAELATLIGHTSGVSSCAISPDGRCVISGGDNTIKVWDMERQAEITALRGHANSVSSCGISPDGRFIIDGGENTIKVWDMKSGAGLVTFEGHTESVKSCAISPDGKCIVTSSVDKTLKIWDIESGEELTTLEGHTSGVSSCAISPDGKRIVSGSWDQTLKVWDMKSGAGLATFEGHTESVKSCAISPDGKRIISGSCDKTLKVWDTENGILLHTFVLLGDCLSCKTGWGGKYVAGDSIGGIYILKLMGDENVEIPRITLLHLWSLIEEKWVNDIGVYCQWCGIQFTPSAEITDAIADITQSARLGPYDSPCLKLPRQAWEDPRLLSECPHCHNPLRFNPFIVDNRVRDYSPNTIEKSYGVEPDIFSSLDDNADITQTLEQSAQPDVHINPDLPPADDPVSRKRAKSDHAARLNIAYQEELAAWKALPFWKRLMVKKPEPPQSF